MAPNPKVKSDGNSTPFGKLIGRQLEVSQIRACLRAHRNVLLEGPVGVGKTHLALAAAAELGIPSFRVDGDSRYSEQKLCGWFDPPGVLQKGYSHETFIPGPLVEAMQKGGVLFINELNRLPEGVQNVLLPAIDERMILVPRLGEIRAEKNFLVIATQNPKEFVATSHLSEAILDRFELVVLDYQSEEEETRIVENGLSKGTGLEGSPVLQNLPLASVRLIRMTRTHPKIRRGASVRAALSVAEITAGLVIGDRMDFRKAFLSAALLALPTRIEIEREADSEETHRAEVLALVSGWCEVVLDQLDLEKKK